MAGEKLADLPPIPRDVAHIAVKEAVFPFARFPGIDPVLSPEMKSTGEVMGIAGDFPTAFLKSQQGGGTRSADQRHPVRLGQGQRQADDRRAGAGADRARLQRRSRPAAPPTISQAEGLEVERVNKVAQGRPAYRRQDQGRRRSASSSTPPRAGRATRTRPRSAPRRVMQKVPYFTTAASARAVARAIAVLRDGGLEVRSLQDYYSASRA